MVYYYDNYYYVVYINRINSIKRMLEQQENHVKS